MPVMPRISGKARKIVQKIMGTPGPLRQQNEKDAALNKRIQRQSSSLVKGVGMGRVS